MDHAPPAFLAGLPKGVLAPDPALVARLVADLEHLMDALYAFHPFGTAQVTFGDHKSETLLISRPEMGDTTITCFGADRDDRARCHAASIALAKHAHATMLALTVSC